MPEAARNYPIAHLEICGLAININSIIDHLALTHILKGKTEPVTNRKKQKGFDMILRDCLSSLTHDILTSNAHCIPW